MDYAQESLNRHRLLRGKLSITPKAPLINRDDLSAFYTPGIAAVSKAIAEEPAKSWEYTWRGNLVAVISDGSAVLGLGNIGAEAAQPVMAGKSLLFKEFAGIDAVPIVLDTQDTDEIVATVRHLAPTFGGINLEDISAPRCFAVEAALQDLGIPVMHDDQHGTAVVVLAGLMNAMKVTGKDLAACRIVISGAGAAGTAIANILNSHTSGGAEILVLDRTGVIVEGREKLNEAKAHLASITNRGFVKGGLAEALDGADIFIGVSQAGLLTGDLIGRMGKDPVIFALANPVPEIMPDEARQAGAAVVATGRSDFPNQVNNVLAFPGIFRGALDAGATCITENMLTAAANALAEATGEVSVDRILPNPLDRTVAGKVAEAVRNQAEFDGVLRP